MNIKAFITQMDQQAFRAIAVTLFMFVLVIMMVLLGRRYLGLDEHTLQQWFGGVSDSLWALPVTIIVFCLAAFIGAPQWALIAGAVIAFGPMNGALFSWVATLVSASANFCIGRVIGAKRVERFGGALVNRMIALVQRNGFVTSFTVRLVPTGPFVLVNMAAGVSRMTFFAFIGGTALGVIPKIATVAFLGQGFVSGLSGNIWVFALSIIAGIALILAVMLFARSRLKNRENRPKNAPSNGFSNKTE